MNPEDLAASRWKPIRQAREHTAKAEQALARSLSRLEELRGQIGPAELHDRQTLGAAIVAGRPEPASEAAALRAELEKEERNREALTQAVTDAYGQIGRLVRENREAWLGQTARERGNEKRRYEAAIAELEAVREGLSNLATLRNWLSTGDVSEAVGDALGGRRGSDQDGRPVLTFTRTLEELRRDCEHLADAQPATRDELIPEPQWQLAHGPGARGLRVLGSLWGGEGP